jgi:predicted ester cyclase
MSAENKLIVRRLYEEVWNRRNLATIDEIIGPDHVNHDPAAPKLGTGTEAYANLVKLYVGALDTQFGIEDQIAEEDRVVTRWTARGRYNTDVTGITIHRIRDGKIVESWGNWDQLGLMHQLKTARPGQPAE